VKVLIVCSDPQRANILAQPVNGERFHALFASRIDHAREDLEKYKTAIAGVICELSVHEDGDGGRYAEELSGRTNVLLVMPEGAVRPLGITTVTSAGDYQGIAKVMVSWRNPPDGRHGL